MPNKQYITMDGVQGAALRVAQYLYHNYTPKGGEYRIYGVPRGGLVPAALVTQELMRLADTSGVQQVMDSAEANFFIDDLVDSGRTRNRYLKEYPGTTFKALFEKTAKTTDVNLSDGKFHTSDWLVFPWEVSSSGVDDSADDIVVRLLQHIGEDLGREGLTETPRRVVKAWGEWFSGYKTDPADVLKVFTDGAENVRGDQMVMVGQIPVYSMCEHHMAPIFGHAWIGYIPNGKIVGLSKFKRLVDVFARRLQVQERLTAQLADALEDTLRPKGLGVLLRCRHMCMESRGTNTPGTFTVTSALRGALLANPAAKQEFMELAK